MPEYAALKKYKDKPSATHGKPNVPPSNTCNSSFPVLQMIRKRVYHTADEFDSNDIYYDKNDGKYYDHIEKVDQKNVEIARDVCAKCNALLEKYSRRTTILAEASLKDSGSNTFIQYNTHLPVDTDPVPANALTFSAGSETANTPKAVRLYAEGTMDHALSLDKTLDSQDMYNKFAALSQSDSQEGISTEVLIKATEFDSRDDLQSRYENPTPFRFQMNQKVRDNLQATHTTKRTEISFGGNTGDMTHAASENPKRRYDLIQATFFWLPKETNKTNFDALKDFMLNQKNKLKENGKIRVTLTDRNNINLQDMNDDQKNAQKNCYTYVADKLTTDNTLNQLYNIEKKVLGQTYAAALSNLGLNPDGIFQHTQTATDKKIDSQGDLVIEATPKQQPQQLPEHAGSDT